MKKFFVVSLSAAVSLLASIFPQESLAVPAFARQTDSPCSACHYQHFPKLNSFGRTFKANGLSLTSRDLIEAENISLPSNLNATFFLRNKYSDDNTGPGVWMIPAEAAILIGGRLADGTGGIVEWGGPLLGAKVMFTRELIGRRVGATVYTTDALGPGYGFELMNTGVVRNHRAFEQSAMPTTGNNDHLVLAGAATGATTFIADAQWFATAGVFIPDSAVAGASEMDAGRHVSHYLRAATFHDVASVELGLGAGMMGGTTRVTAVGDPEAAFGPTNAVYDVNTSAWFVDAQLQGDVASRPLGVYFLYAKGDQPNDPSKPLETNLWGGDDSSWGVPQSWGVDMEYTVIPRMALLAMYGNYDNGNPDLSAKTGWGVGLYIILGQNMTLQPMYETYSGGQGQVNGHDVMRVTATLETVF